VFYGKAENLLFTRKFAKIKQQQKMGNATSSGGAKTVEVQPESEIQITRSADKEVWLISQHFVISYFISNFCFNYRPITLYI
jgi:hypothetical protein